MSQMVRIRNNFMKNINVLILSAGRRVELVKLFKSTRDSLGINGKVVAVDISDTAPALYFADEHCLIPRINAPDYIPAIIEVCKKYSISVIVPTIDTELSIIAKNQELISKQTGALINISNFESVEICQDKTKSAKFFKENGFGVPYTYSEKELDEGNMQFPLFIKPKNGSSSINAFKVNNKRELDFFRQYIQEPIVQECVSGKEYTIDAFIDFDGNIISVVPRLRLAVRSGEVLKGQIDMNSDIIADAKRLIDKLQLVGHVTIQGFFGDDKVMRYIEINPRFGGGAPMSIRAGANSCEFLYKIASGEKIDQQKIHIEDKAIFARFDDSIQVN